MVWGVEMSWPPPGSRGLADGQHVVERGLGVADQVAGGLGHLAQVVRRDLGRHAHRDARGAVQQHEGQARGQQLRLLEGAVVVGG